MPFLCDDMLPLFFLSKPRAVEVTCYQPAKVMAVAPVSTSSIYTTVPGTAVCAFAFVYVCVCLCVLRHAERFIPPTHPYLSAAVSKPWSWAGRHQDRDRKDTSYPNEFTTYLVFGMGTIATSESKWVSALLCSDLVQPQDLNLDWKKKNLLLRCFFFHRAKAKRLVKSDPIMRLDFLQVS